MSARPRIASRNKAQPVALELLAAQILGGDYGGPALGMEPDGAFIVYIWGDAPSGTETLGRGTSIRRALMDAKDRLDKRRYKGVRNGKEKEVYRRVS